MNQLIESSYVLGYTENELQRLIRQSAVYAELTENLLRSAGVGAGMRVLDVGCGSGCVSLLAARLVGASGAVVGVDKSAQALALARQRADAEHLRQVEFIQGDLANLDCKGPFDALIGRFVLMFLPDPAAVLRTLSRHVRKGGVIVFQEMDMGAAKAIPCMPLRKRCTDWIVETFRRAEVDIEMGPKLYATFLHAGLPAPQMNLQARIGSEPELLAHEYLADLIASLLPMMTRLGVATAAAVGVETLATRLREETLSKEGITILPSLIGSWARLPA